MKPRPTIQDVAKATSVSISTISLVLNNKPNVSEETRRRVNQAIRALGYHPVRSARGLASKASGNIGFILADEHFSAVEPFYTRIFLGSEVEARNHNYYILLTTVPKRLKKNDSIPRFLHEKNVDGVIVAGKFNPKLIEYIERLGLPIVLVDYALKGKRYSSVLIDNFKGARAATLHLIETGHSKIAFIGGDPDHPSIGERLAGYNETLRREGLPLDPSLVITDEEDTRIHNGYNAIQRILNQGGKPTAVFAANDAMAIGCMNYLKATGIRIPEDIAIVGFDDIDLSSHVDPPLSTVKVFTEEMGKIAIRRIVEMIKEKTQHVFTVHLPVELVVRASSAPRVRSDPKRGAPISLTRRPRGPAIAQGKDKDHGA
ncbi:MAG TPA: LacI family DNA-binding transcriptional regulator [Bacteroidota bacterium]|nr:LacI family DNA-binding transcriptional regulator [Bacteroidota bacterium]